MAKNQNNEAQNPEEEMLQEQEIVQEEENSLGEGNDGGIRCMVSQVKNGQSKVAEELDEGWTADGVAIVDGEGQTLLIVSLNESQTAFGGSNSEDLQEDIASPSMSTMDGEMRSAFLSSFYKRDEKEVPALDACAEYGWLPSGGEMALIFANKESVNEMLEALGGDTIGDGRYWTSQRFSNDRMWSCDMEDGTFGIALGTASEACVRAVKK